MARFPELKRQIGDYFDGFIANTRKKRGVGIVGLVLTALILTTGFTLFYKIVPSRFVAWRDASIGGGTCRIIVFRSQVVLSGAVAAASLPDWRAS